MLHNHLIDHYYDEKKINKIEYTQTKPKFQLKIVSKQLLIAKCFNLSIKSSIKNIILLLFNPRLCAIRLKGKTHFAIIREKDIAKHLLNTHLKMSRGFSTRVFFLLLLSNKFHGFKNSIYDDSTALHLTIVRHHRK